MTGSNANRRHTEDEPAAGCSRTPVGRFIVLRHTEQWRGIVCMDARSRCCGMIPQSLENTGYDHLDMLQTARVGLSEQSSQNSWPVLGATVSITDAKSLSLNGRG